MSFIDFLNRLFGDSNKKELKKLWPIVCQVKECHASQAIQQLTLSHLPEKTEELKVRVSQLSTISYRRHSLLSFVHVSFSRGRRYRSVGKNSLGI